MHITETGQLRSGISPGHSEGGLGPFQVGQETRVLSWSAASAGPDRMRPAASSCDQHANGLRQPAGHAGRTGALATARWHCCSAIPPHRHSTSHPVTCSKLLNRMLAHELPLANRTSFNSCPSNRQKQKEKTAEASHNPQLRSHISLLLLSEHDDLPMKKTFWCHGVMFRKMSETNCSISPKNSFSRQ